MYSSKGGIVILPRCPSYRIVAIEAKSRRDGRALQELGYYDPIKGYVGLDLLSITALLTRGAQPSNTVKHLIEKARILSNTTNLTNTLPPGKTQRLEFNYKKIVPVLTQK